MIVQHFRIDYRCPRRMPEEMVALVQAGEPRVFTNVREEEHNEFEETLRDLGYIPKIYFDRSKPELGGRYLLSIERK